MPAAHVWNPTEGIVERANVTRFMRRTGSPLTMSWSVARPPTSRWFWEAVVEDLGIQFFRPYDTLLDLSRGVPWSRWFIGGAINLADHCLDRHARSAAPRTNCGCLGGRGWGNPPAVLCRASQ